MWQETVAPKPTDDKVLSTLKKGFWKCASADWSSKSRSAAALTRTLLNLDHERFLPVFYELLACLASASQHNPVAPQQAFWKCAVLEVLCIPAKEFVTPFSTDLFGSEASNLPNPPPRHETLRVGSHVCLGRKKVLVRSLELGSSFPAAAL